MQTMLRKGVSLPARPARASVKAMAVSTKPAVGQKAALVAATAAVLGVAPARAADVPVDSAVDTVISAVKATGEVVKSTITTLEAGAQAAKEAYDVAAPVLNKAVQAATPVVEQAIKVTADVAGPAFKAALPAIQDAGKVLESTGINPSAVSDATSTVVKTTSTAVSATTPLLSKFLQFLASTDPLTLGEYALGLLVLGYATPLLLGGLGGSLRGFAGEIGAAAALETLLDESNVAMIDIRTEKEKEGSGIPDVPSAASGKVVEVEFAITEDKRLRGQLRDPGAIEAQVTALQIASLKKIGKGTKLILLDRYGPVARQVAKELSRKGYSKVFVLQGGFDGRGGWVQSKLQIKPAATLISAAPPAIAKTVFTRGSKALPAPKA